MIHIKSEDVNKQCSTNVGPELRREVYAMDLILLDYPIFSLFSDLIFCNIFQTWSGVPRVKTVKKKVLITITNFIPENAALVSLPLWGCPDAPVHARCRSSSLQGAGARLRHSISVCWIQSAAGLGTDQEETQYINLEPGRPICGHNGWRVRWKDILSPYVHCS